MKLLFLIRSLNLGGAERQLVVLAKGMKHRGHQVTVAVYYPGGPLQTELDVCGIPVISLQKRNRWDVFGFMWRLLQQLKRLRPEVLQSYLCVSNILSILMKPFFPGTKMVWGVRASNMDFARYDWLLGFSYRVEALLSRFADGIIANSHAGRTFAENNGFACGKMEVIPNGIDTRAFTMDPEAGARVRREWGIGRREIVIGLAARLDPMKDHPTFLRAASKFRGRYPAARFVCVGPGPAAYRNQLEALARRLQLDDSLVWAGPRSDMAAVYNAFDIATSSSSFGEGFSNVIGEAMACGVPCAVTGAGDAALIVGDLGEVVPPGDPDALCAAWMKLASDRYRNTRLRRRCRSRIEECFSVARLLDRTERFLLAVR